MTWSTEGIVGFYSWLYRDHQPNWMQAMPTANTYRIDELSRFLQVGVETVYDQAPTLGPTDVFATQNLQGQIYQGDSEEIRFDGDSGVDIPQLTTNPYNGFSFDFYGAGSGTAGVAPHASKIFLICGGDELVTTGTDVRYTTANVANADSGTFMMYHDLGATGGDEFLQYVTTGARGQLGFSFTDGKKAMFKVSNLMGAYYEPSFYQVPVVTDFGTQKTLLPLDTNFANTAVLEFAGHQLCVQSLDIDNVFGVTTSRADQPGCRSTASKRITPQINITFRMPDWNLAFNPYAKANTSGGVFREPFHLQIGNAGIDDGNILSILGAGNNETQLTNVQETIMSDGNVGMTATIRCLSGLELIYS